MQLKNTKVYRGGATARNLIFETNSVEYRHFEKDNIEFIFNIDSKGGGQTTVMVKVSIDDLYEIVRYTLHKDRLFFIENLEKFEETMMEIHKNMFGKISEDNDIEF